MSSLSMVEAKLPPGFRFHPRDDELICDYLMKRFASCDTSLLIEVDLNKCEPWDLPEIACIGGKEWYFYSQRDRKYATGLRTNRATVSGYWKATGKDRSVSRNGSLVGMRKTLVFYQGRAPKGKKTEWVMHEFRLEGPLAPPKLPPSNSKEDWVLCRVFHKTGELSGKLAIMAHTTSTSSYEMEPSPSSLPALMDSYINFDHTLHITPVRDDNDNNNNNNNNSNNNISNDSFEQVPCFSIFNQNQTNPPTLSQLFNMEPNNIARNKNNIINNPMGLYHTTTTTTRFGSNLQNGVFTTTNNAATMSTSDKQVIKAVLSQLTKLEGASPASNMKGSSSISLGEAASSESYLSDVGLPTMWSNYY